MTVLPGRIAAVAALGLALGLSAAPSALASTADPCAVYPGTCEPSPTPIGDVDEDTDTNGPGPSTGVDDSSDGDDTDSGPTGGSGSGTSTGGSLDAAPDSLPLTGGEATLLALVGVGALAGGTALVVASRRRAA